jgi:hypothetical protein
VRVNAASRQLARQWIHAIILSAAVQTAGSTLLIILSRMLSVAETDSRALVAIFLLLAGVITALAQGIYGFLIGQVLECKLPTFPLRSWIAVNALLGLIFGPLLGLGLMTPTDSDPNPWITASLAVQYVVIGAIVNALEGSVQALILRKVAYGAGTWIACSALTGVCWLLIIPDIPGIFRELTSTATALLQILSMGLILLPALLRLRPRGPQMIPMLFE